MPEHLWKAYIDFEIAQGQFDKARSLYERLLSLTKHVRVWLSFAEFEAQVDEGKSRVVFERAAEYYREHLSADKVQMLSDDQQDALRHERAELLAAWLAFEKGLTTRSTEQDARITSLEAR